MFFSLEMPRGRPETTGLYSVKRRPARPFLCRRNHPCSMIPEAGVGEHRLDPGTTKSGFRIIYLSPLPL
jgi:hypothetical protein